MNPKPSREETLFFAAAEMATPEMRVAYLDRECAGDAALRQRVEALLAKSLQADAFFGEDLKSAAEGPAGTVIVPITEKAGDIIGRYKLLQQIGEGGCGVVYMAEQSVPVKRRVALKVIKLGMDTKQVIARFEAERQALALMDHPNIAKVLDAGATDAGRPFFVMELVRGTKITEFCDQQKLSTGERLDLFIQVCSAIQHAHQKGIIHRDIKPSNVLVTMIDGKAVPKVIDFGIAKATSGQELTDKTLFTAFEQFIGTPAYMSPEQATMSGVDIDTRSDIYSLGVLLYELLTGRTPFDAQELLRSGIEGIRKTLKEQEPPKPSTRLNTLADVDLTTVANARQVEPPKLLHAVRGDLDWVVMKCLEKDRARRYETANGLAADLKRHLGNEPIVARPPSMSYLLQKAYRRNKLVFAAATAVALALLVGIIASTWQAVRAKRAEALATERLGESEKARADAEAISKFITAMFESSRPGEEKGGRDVKVADVLDIAAKKLETELAGQPERRAKLQATLGGTYKALGLYPQAVSLREKVWDYHRATSGPDHPDTLKAMNDLASSHLFAGRREQARKMHEEVLAVSRRVLGPEHPDTLSAARNLADLLNTHGAAGPVYEALKLREEVLAISRKLLGPEHPDTLSAMDHLAVSYRRVDRPAEALKMQEEVLSLFRKVNGPEHPSTIGAMTRLADSYYYTGRNDEALKLREEVLALSRRVLGPEHPDTIATMQGLAKSYSAAGRRDEALKMREEVLSLRRKVSGPEHPDTFNAVQYLTASYLDAGRQAEAIALGAEVSNLSPFYTHSALFLGAIQVWFTKEDEHTATARRMLAWAANAGRADDAERVAKLTFLRPVADPSMVEAALALARKAHKGIPKSPWGRMVLGMAEYRSGRFQEADAALSAVAGLISPRTYRPNAVQGTAGFYRTMSLFQLGRKDEARALFTATEGQMRPFPVDEKNPLAGNADHDDLILWMAFKEAKALLAQPVPSAK